MFEEAREFILRIMEMHGRGVDAKQYAKVKEIHELLLVRALACCPPVLAISKSTVPRGSTLRNEVRTSIVGCLLVNGGFVFVGNDAAFRDGALLHQPAAQATKLLLEKETASNKLIDWIKKGDATLVDRYMDTRAQSVDLNFQTGKVRWTLASQGCSQGCWASIVGVSVLPASIDKDALQTASTAAPVCAPPRPYRFLFGYSAYDLGLVVNRQATLTSIPSSCFCGTGGNNPADCGM